MQLTDYGCKVDDTSILHGGKDVLVSRCGHQFPLGLHDRLCYLDIRYPTAEDEATLDTVILTSDKEWYPSKCNDIVSVRDRLKHMTETTTTNGYLEYTTDDNIMIAQAGAIVPTDVPQKKRLSRNSS